MSYAHTQKRKLIRRLKRRYGLNWLQQYREHVERLRLRLAK
jgi:hypothetical protein